jgi:DNA-binding NarL/FixJ family response regulator
MIKIFIIDGNEIFKDGLTNKLHKEKNFLIVGCFENGMGIIQDILQDAPDVIIIDIKSNHGNGFDLIERIFKKYPKGKIIILTYNTDGYYISKAMNIGINGYLTKDCDIKEISLAINKIISGENYFCENILKKLREYNNMLLKNNRESILVRLNPIEYNILKLLSDGMNMKQIAGELNISERTVYRKIEGIKIRFVIKNDVELYGFIIKYFSSKTRNEI